MMRTVQLRSVNAAHTRPTELARFIHGRTTAAGEAASARGVRPDPAATAWAEDLWDSHGPSIYALAYALLGDEAASMQAVALGMVDFFRSDVSTSAEDTKRALARHVYLRSTELASETSSSTPQPPVMGRLAQLARLQRASLALCTFGGHTYDEAAEVLSIAPATVAQLLTAGLNELSRPHAGVIAG